MTAMTATATGVATYADLQKLPDSVRGELINGELFATPRPAARHAAISSALGSELGGAFQSGRFGPGGWWIIDEPELHLGSDVLVPDLAGWRKARMPEIPDAPAFELEPDWACEILSPSTARIDLMHKLPRYGKAGVAFAWIINPPLRALEAFRLDAGRWILAGAWSGAERIRAPPFEDFELDLAMLWEGLRE